MHGLTNNNFRRRAIITSIYPQKPPQYLLVRKRQNAEERTLTKSWLCDRTGSAAVCWRCAPARAAGRAPWIQRRAACYQSRRINAKLATISATKNTSVQPAIERCRNTQPFSAHSPLPSNTRLTTSVKRQRVQHVVEAHPARWHLVLRQRLQPDLTRGERGARAADDELGDGVSGRARAPGVVEPTATRNTSAMPMKAMRWKMHSGHGSSCSTNCR